MLTDLPTAALFAANILYLVSYAVKDVLLLRIFCVTAILISLPYYVCGTEATQWVVIYWQLAFIALNVFWIIVIFKERKAPEMSEDEKSLYDDVFQRSCSPQDMLRLLSIAKSVSYEAGAKMVEEDSSPGGLMLIENGTVKVVRNGTSLASLKRGNFVCEMSYLTGEPAAADVVAASTSQVLHWTTEDLDKLFAGRPELKSSVAEIIGRDLISKISTPEQRGPELSVETLG